MTVRSVVLELVLVDTCINFQYVLIRIENKYFFFFNFFFFFLGSRSCVFDVRCIEYWSSSWFNNMVNSTTCCKKSSGTYCKLWLVLCYCFRCHIWNYDVVPCVLWLACLSNSSASGKIQLVCCCCVFSLLYSFVLIILITH